MDPRNKKFLAAVLAIGMAIALIFTSMGLAAGTSTGDPGSSPENPIIVSSESDIPTGAVVDSQVNKDCSTTYTGVLTVPATDSTEHQEWGTEERTRVFNPGSDAITHEVYSYVKTVQDFTVKYQYQKQVKGVVQTRVYNQGPWLDTGKTFDWEWWIGGSTQWSFDDVAVLQSGPHNSTQEQWTENGDPWRKQTTHYQYVKNGVTDEVPSGSHQEFSGEVLEPLSAPWELLAGYPTTVVDTEAVPASYGPWSAWETRSSGDLVEPVLPEDTDTHQYRTTEPTTVVDADGTPEVVVYYEYNDEETCDDKNPPSEPPAPAPPNTDEGTPTYTEKCVGDALVLVKTDKDGNIESTYINGALKCTKKGVTYTEEGM